MRAWRLVLCTALILFASPPIQNRVGAEDAPYQGFGAATRGGADGALVRVSNLNDSGPGSLRDALMGGHRTVVFDVAGEIVLNDHLYLREPFITIDGFSAPAPGITLRNRGLIIRGNRGAHDVIVRGLRVRDSAHDGIQIAYGAYNVVVDHVSVTGSADGNIDITEGARDVTVSWSVLGGNQKNMLVKYNPARVTLHHNLFVESAQRSPQVRIDDAGGVATETTADIRNNVIAGWGGGYGTIIWHGPWANLVANFYSSAGDAVTVTAARAFVSGNQTATGADLDGASTESAAFPAPAVDTQDACAAAWLVVGGAGVRPLDTIDDDYVASVGAPPCAPGPVPPPIDPPAPPAPGTPPVTDSITVQLRVASGTDDAREGVRGGVATGQGRIAVGADTLFAARFTGVAIPRGSVIVSAVLEVFALDNAARPVTFRYRGEASGDSRPFRRTDRDLSSRPPTRAFVDDRPAAWNLDRFNAGPDLTSVVQEIVNRSDWQAGHALTLFIDGAASEDRRMIGTFESRGGPGTAATLTIRYRP